MTYPNGHDNSGVGVQTPPTNQPAQATAEQPAAILQPDPVTRAKLRARQKFRQNRFVIIGAGMIVVALLTLVATSIPRRPVTTSKNKGVPRSGAPPQSPTAASDKSLFPITDSGRPAAKESQQGFLNEQDLDKTAMHQRASTAGYGTQSSAPETLGSIAPFGGEEPWQAPAYQPGVARGAELANVKADRETIEKSSFVYVRSLPRSQSNSQNIAISGNSQPEIGLGLATGTRLRARLESAASTAVRTPVLAVIEYNYEHDGEIIVPAGAKAVGHIQEADRSGYVRIQFESILMPDGGAVPIQAEGTDLDLRPLKGRVAGKNTGKNILIKSISGIGAAGAILVGRGGLNQPLSESDLLRERVSNNIGEASDEQISRMTVTQRLAVTVAAGTPLYVVLEQAPKAATAATAPNGQTRQPGAANTEELRQLLQLQRELNLSTTNN